MRACQIKTRLKHTSLWMRRAGWMWISNRGFTVRGRLEILGMDSNALLKIHLSKLLYCLLATSLRFAVHFLYSGLSKDLCLTAKDDTGIKYEMRVREKCWHTHLVSLARFRSPKLEARFSECFAMLQSDSLLECASTVKLES